MYKKIIAEGRNLSARLVKFSTHQVQRIWEQFKVNSKTEWIVTINPQGRIVQTIPKSMRKNYLDSGNEGCGVSVLVLCNKDTRKISIFKRTAQASDNADAISFIGGSMNDRDLVDQPGERMSSATRLHALLREVAEETGLVISESQVSLIGEFFMSKTSFDAKVPIYKGEHPPYDMYFCIHMVELSSAELKAMDTNNVEINEIDYREEINKVDLEKMIKDTNLILDHSIIFYPEIILDFLARYEIAPQ